MSENDIVVEDDVKVPPKEEGMIYLTQPQRFLIEEITKDLIKPLQDELNKHSTYLNGKLAEYAQNVGIPIDEIKDYQFDNERYAFVIRNGEETIDGSDKR